MPKALFQVNLTGMQIPIVLLFIYLGFYVAFNTVQVISQRVVGRAEETSTYSLSGFCKLPTDSKQLPAFPLEAMPETKPRPQRWEARVLPLGHRGPLRLLGRIRAMVGEW